MDHYEARAEFLLWPNRKLHLVAFLTLCPTGVFGPHTMATGNDRPRTKTIVEGNPQPPPWYGVQKAYEVVCVSGEGPLVPNPPS